MSFEFPVVVAEEPKKKSKSAEALAAVMLAGTLAHSPEAVALQDVEQSKSGDSEATIVKKDESKLEEALKQSMLYSEYMKGKRQTPETVSERDKRLAEETYKTIPSFEMPVERAVNDQEATIRDTFLIDKTFEMSRVKLNQALQKIAETTGTSANMAVQIAGSALINIPLRYIDGQLSEKIRGAIVKGMSEGDAKDTLAFFSSVNNAENMLFSKQLGEQGKWQLTVGADPSVGFGGKFDPKVGVTFRMILP